MLWLRFRGLFLFHPDALLDLGGRGDGGRGGGGRGRRGSAPGPPVGGGLRRRAASLERGGAPSIADAHAVSCCVCVGYLDKLTLFLLYKST